MPELPEVHALVADLDSRLGGRIIASFDIVSFAALKTFDPQPSALAAATIVGVSRQGKFLDITCSTAAAGVLHVIIHLARAGWIRWRDGAPLTPRSLGGGPLAARLVLDDGSGFDITEAGSKKSLALYVVTDPALVPGIARLGPDPLQPQFTEEVFAGILARSGRAQVKSVLRNQANIAGIGNAYSDEILHTAKMSPFKPAAMTADEAARLYAAVQSTLRGAISRTGGLTASQLKREKKSGLQVHGRTGEACPICGDIVREVIFADSTLQYCPTCQTGGKRLADRVLSRLLK